MKTRTPASFQLVEHLPQRLQFVGVYGLRVKEFLNGRVGSAAEHLDDESPEQRRGNLFSRDLVAEHVGQPVALFVDGQQALFL